MARNLAADWKFIHLDLAEESKQNIPATSRRERRKALIVLLEFEPGVPGSLSISNPPAKNQITKLSALYVYGGEGWRQVI